MSAPTTTVLYGDAWDLASTLEPSSVDCIVTSPPYYSLRSYLPDDHPDKPREFGLETHPDEYVDKLVDLFARLRPALKETATVWLNLGFTYATGAGKVGDSPGGGSRGQKWQGPRCQANRMPLAGYKPKDIIPVPWLVGLALQADGWWLRAPVIIWSKTNGIPDSAKDRPGLTHEYVLLLSKSRRYYFDMEAVLEPLRSGPSDLRKMAEGKERIGGLVKDQDDPKLKASATTNIGRRRSVGNKQAATAALALHSGRKYAGFNERWDAAESAGELPGGRHIRSVWEIATQSYEGAHFATMPPRLAERCILAGAPPPRLGARSVPWLRDHRRGSAKTGARLYRLRAQRGISAADREAAGAGGAALVVTNASLGLL